MEYIPEHKRDTRYGLWYVRYLCTVPYIQMLDVEELEQYGLPTSGDRHHDHAMQWEPRLVRLPIHRMAELWKSGANVALKNKDDAVKIYEAIMAHLMAWKHHVETSYHRNNPPVEDLLTLDQFANTVYEHAKPAYDTTFVQKHFKISSSSAIGRRAMLNSMTKAAERRAEAEERGMLVVKNINLQIVQPKYDPNAETQFIDYSGRDREIVAPQRESLAKFFKKGKEK